MSNDVPDRDAIPPDNPEWISCDGCLAMFHEDELEIDDLSNLLCAACLEEQKTENEGPDKAGI